MKIYSALGFEINCNYLVESKHGISKCTVKEVSNLCVKVKWETGTEVWLKIYNFLVHDIKSALTVIEKLN